MNVDEMMEVEVPVGKMVEVYFDDAGRIHLLQGQCMMANIKLRSEDANEKRKAMKEKLEEMKVNLLSRLRVWRDARGDNSFIDGIYYLLIGESGADFLEDLEAFVAQYGKAVEEYKNLIGERA